ncbi:MAG: hypothetical protein QM708_11545 [Propioniciclava sp.]|uniref:hypothetical protein n=1 Tax=Propioniciclava sp. TaxID=2038686 RepID=UPI0039E49576
MSARLRSAVAAVIALTLLAGGASAASAEDVATPSPAASTPVASGETATPTPAGLEANEDADAPASEPGSVPVAEDADAASPSAEAEPVRDSSPAVVTPASETPPVASRPATDAARVGVLAAERLSIAQQPEHVSAAQGGNVRLSALSSGGTAPVTVQWERSTTLSAAAEPTRWTTSGLDRAVTPTFTFNAGATPHQGNRWYRAVFTDADGTTATTRAVKLTILPAPTMTRQPAGQTVRAGQSATFRAAASSEGPMNVRWQSTKTALPNGDPDGATWADVAQATGEELTVADVATSDHGTFYRAVFSNAAGSVESQPAQLQLYERLDTNGRLTVRGESYGPPGFAPSPFAVTAPNAVVKGRAIVIEGEGYLHTDGRTGSVVNVMVDAGYSGDPNTLNSTRTIINPATGEEFADPRSHGMVQAGADGRWRLEIPWPDASNTDRDAAFFAQNWGEGSQHFVRILSGSQLTGDYQRGISVRFTVVGSATEPASAPQMTAQPADASVTAGDTATFTAAASGRPAPSVQWESRTPAGAWAPIAGATGETLRLDGVTTTSSGTQYRAVFTNSAGSVTSAHATLTVAASGIGVATHPADQSAEAGERARFTAIATGSEISTQWERSRDGVTWEAIRGALGPIYVIEPVLADDADWTYRARFTNPGNAEGVLTQAASLTVTPRENVREYCGLSYGPSGYEGERFCFSGPEKVMPGQDIVIRGTGGYLATDGATGSVVNFFLDALYSGDPRTIYVKQPVAHPVTGSPVDDRRTHAMVQASGDGTWTATIPWPSVGAVSPAQDGIADFTQADLDRRFAPGTTHAVRMLSGSLLNTPPDIQRGATWYFTVVGDLNDQVPVAEPIYPHETLTATSAGDRAVAWVPSTADSGLPVPLTGTGWLTKDHAAGSVVEIRLTNENGGHYRRAGTAEDPHADPDDPTVWQRVHVRSTGVLDTRIDLPASVTAGSYLAVQLRSEDDGTPRGDVAREWTSKPLTVDGTPWTAPVTEGCTAAPGEAVYQLAPGMAVPAANVGGTIRLTGQKWCNTVTGRGSYIAIKINDGAFSHKGSASAKVFNAELGRETGLCAADACTTNKTIWYVIEARDDGSFDVNIPLPDRTNTTPAFREGSYTLRIMTATLAGDPYYGGVREASRTMQSPEFTVVAEGVGLDNVKPGKPTLPPDPLHATDDLTGAVSGGVQVDQRSDRWIVTVPGAQPGDWVYANVYEGASPRFPWGAEWFEVAADRTIALPLAGVTLPVGVNKLSVQDRAGRILGWTTVRVAEPAPIRDAPPVPLPIPRPSAGVTAQLKSVTSQPKPTIVPAAPVATYADLTEANLGGATGVEADGKVVVTLPGIEGGRWVFLYLYTETGAVRAVDWVQVGTDHTVTVETGVLPDGSHKLAFVDEAAQLVGWVTVNGPRPLALAAPAAQAAAAGLPALAPAAAGADPTMTLVLIGLGLLVLAGSATGVILLRTPAPTPASRRAN